MNKPRSDEPTKLTPQARPVFVLGAGAIVRDAQLPAYRRDGVPIGGFFDLHHDRAVALAATFPGAEAFATRDALIVRCSAVNGIYDLALPPQALTETLTALPRGATVLVQKPFGSTLNDATALLQLADARGIRGAVNFQLRFAPAIVALRALIAEGVLGEIVDFEIRIVCRMPWNTWPFLEGMPRMEILMHSIHYLDLARAILGEPERVWSAAFGHTADAQLAETRSTTVLGFRGGQRAVLSTYHHHDAPPKHDASHLRIEGTLGTAVARLGVNLDYPRGRTDTLEVSTHGGAWRSIELSGSWFPDAFGGPMRELQQLARDPTFSPQSNFADAWRTMALVEACYASAAKGERVPTTPLEN